jgi:adenylate cyclase
LPPEEVVRILNLYLGAMSDTIAHYNGTINEFIGDGIFVLFGAPIQREDDAKRAIACAVAMQNAMIGVNQQNLKLGLPTLEMGIGINTGEVVVGNIGSQKRAKYTVIGSHANLAARIETYTVGGQVLVSEYTCQEAGAHRHDDRDR